jgi:hypothetical protein
MRLAVAVRAFFICHCRQLMHFGVPGHGRWEQLKVHVTVGLEEPTHGAPCSHEAWQVRPGHGAPCSHEPGRQGRPTGHPALVRPGNGALLQPDSSSMWQRIVE